MSKKKRTFSAEFKTKIVLKFTQIFFVPMVVDSMHQQFLEDKMKIGVNNELNLMNKIWIQAIYPKKRKLTPIKNQKHKFYLFQLKQSNIFSFSVKDQID